jgi:hypothetical protein
LEANELFSENNGFRSWENGEEISECRNRNEKSEILDFDEGHIKQAVINSIRTLDASLKRQLV